MLNVKCDSSWFCPRLLYGKVSENQYTKILTFSRAVTSREREKYNKLPRNVSRLEFDKIITCRTLRIVLILKFDLIPISKKRDSWDLIKISCCSIFLPRDSCR